MRRDMDLCRKIMLNLDSAPNARDWISQKFEGYTDEEVSYNVMLLHEAGLIEARNLSSGADLVWQAERLTWQGHEFLDASRNNTIWKKAKEIGEKAGSTAFTVLLQVLIELGKAEAAKYLPK